MRKKWLLIAALAILLIVMLVTRCGKKDKTADTDVQLSGVAKQPVSLSGSEKPLGVVTAQTDGQGIEITVDRNGESVVYAFSDINIDSWFVDAVNYAVSNGLMSGVDDGSGESLFHPDYGMTRAQLAMILYRFAGGEPVEPKHSYSDVPDYEWYYDCVNWADAQGLITPSGADSFGVNEYCSCEEVLVILHRLTGSPASTASLEGYPYAPKVSESGINAVRWAWEKGLIAEDECVWYPTQAISRAQIALLLMRYDRLIGSPSIEN